jgi:hypothetical protein
VRSSESVGRYRVYRRANRPFRRAFRGIVSGERDRRILLKAARVPK